MREFLDGIFSHIGSSSLTDNEYETINTALPADYTKEVYEALRTVLENRENVSGQTKKLKLFFLSKGIDLNGSAIATANSNIFIGTPL
jgi:hypothetical protein